MSKRIQDFPLTPKLFKQIINGIEPHKIKIYDNESISAMQIGVGNLPSKLRCTAVGCSEVGNEEVKYIYFFCFFREDGNDIDIQLAAVNVDDNFKYITSKKYFHSNFEGRTKTKDDFDLEFNPIISDFLHRTKLAFGNYQYNYGEFIETSIHSAVKFLTRKLKY